MITTDAMVTANSIAGTVNNNCVNIAGIVNDNCT